MSEWRKVDLYLTNQIEESPDYEREMHLTVNWYPGYPAFTKGAPEDCYPAEAPQFEILAAQYDNGAEVPQDVIDRITDDQLREAMSGEIDYDRDDS